MSRTLKGARDEPRCKGAATGFKCRLKKNRRIFALIFTDLSAPARSPRRRGPIRIATMLTIRAAEVEDASAIARVHVETWRSTYTGIIPQNYLDGMTTENRALVWARLLQRSGPAFPTLVSEDHD